MKPAGPLASSADRTFVRIVDETTTGARPVIDDMSARLTHALSRLSGSVGRRKGERTLWGRAPWTRLRAEEKNGRVTLTLIQGFASSSTVIIVISTSEPERILSADAGDLLTCMLTLLAGGAGAPDETTLSSIRAAADVCSNMPETPEPTLMLIKTGNPFEDVHLRWCGPDAARIERPTDDQMLAMTGLPEMIVMMINPIRNDLGHFAVVEAWAEAGREADPLQLMRAHSMIGSKKGGGWRP